MKKDATDRRRRMQKLLAVALSTTEAGECHGACQALRRVLEADGKDVHWLLTRLKLEPAKTAPFKLGPGTGPTVPDWTVILQYLSEDHSLLCLQPRELEFIMSVKEQEGTRQYWQPTYRQLQWLESIYMRVRAVRSLF
jgi:hypothetical protein